MSEIREAISSANTELSGSTETKSTETKTPSTETRSTERQGSESTGSKWSAPKWTQQWKRESIGALSKLAELDADGAYLSPVLREVEERYDYSGKMQKDLETYRKRFDPYSDVLQNLEQRFAFQGMPGPAGLQQMAMVSDYLARDPDQALMWLAAQFKPRDVKALVEGLAKNFGVDLGELVKNQQWVDPAVKQLLDQQISPLQQQNQQLMQMLQGQYSTQYQQASYSIANHIKAFLEAKDDQGQPKYPYYQKLEPIMAAIIKSSGPIMDMRQVNLEQLYEQAAWLDPETREKMIADRAKAAEAKAIKDAQESNRQAEEAHRASRNVNGGAQSRPKNTRGASVRQIAQEEWKRLSNR